MISAAMLREISNEMALFGEQSPLGVVLLDAICGARKHTFYDIDAARAEAFRDKFTERGCTVTLTDPDEGGNRDVMISW